MATTKTANATKTTPKKTTTKAKSDAPKTKAASKKTVKATPANAIPASKRYKMIEVAAYYLAEKSNFTGNAAEYWVMAEREISAKYPK